MQVDSKRTINFLSSMDKLDASIFQNLYSFCWSRGDLQPLIYDENAEVYEKNGIDFTSLKHLNEIGLISYQPLAIIEVRGLPKQILIKYFGKPVVIEFTKDTDNNLDTGHILYSKIGLELSSICDAKPIEGYFEYIVDYLSKKNGLTVTVPEDYDFQSSITADPIPKIVNDEIAEE